MNSDMVNQRTQDRAWIVTQIFHQHTQHVRPDYADSTRQPVIRSKVNQPVVPNSAVTCLSLSMADDDDDDDTGGKRNSTKSSLNLFLML